MDILIKQAADAVRSGELIVFPTDTVFGIGCDPFNENALKRLYAVKKRPLEKNIPVLVNSIRTAHTLGHISESCEALCEKYWPGPLTVVVMRKQEKFPEIAKREEIGLRMPDHLDVLELLELVGGALATTSANMSGQPSITTYEEARAAFASTVAAVLPGVAKEAEASTIIDCTTDEHPVLRQGPVVM